MMHFHTFGCTFLGNLNAFSTKSSVKVKLSSAMISYEGIEGRKLFRYDKTLFIKFYSMGKGNSTPQNIKPQVYEFYQMMTVGDFFHDGHRKSCKPEVESHPRQFTGLFPGRIRPFLPYHIYFIMSTISFCIDIYETLIEGVACVDQQHPLKGGKWLWKRRHRIGMEALFFHPFVRYRKRLSVIHN